MQRGLTTNKIYPMLEIIMPDHLTLWQAMLMGNTDALQIILQNRVDIDSICDQSKTAYTALHHTSAQGHGITVRLLLQHNTDFNKIGLDRMTALHLAALNSYKESVCILLKHGTDVNQ
jgi:ankyrin repeat protein